MVRRLPHGTNMHTPQRKQSHGIADHDAETNYQRTNYHKGANGGRHGSGKEIHEDNGAEMHMTGGHYDSNGNNGPTGSSRIYPHGRSREMSIPHHIDWNPMELVPSTYGICGVDHYMPHGRGHGRHD